MLMGLFLFLSAGWAVPDAGGSVPFPFSWLSCSWWWWIFSFCFQLVELFLMLMGLFLFLSAGWAVPVAAGFVSIPFSFWGCSSRRWICYYSFLWKICSVAYGYVIPLRWLNDSCSWPIFSFSYDKVELFMKPMNLFRFPRLTELFLPLRDLLPFLLPIT
jgi:hypothetical protein